MNENEKLEVQTEVQTEEQAAPVQAEPSADQRLDLSEILGSLQVAQAEANRWNGVATTLTKCAILFDSIIKAQQKAGATTEEQVEEPTSGVSEN